MAETVTDVGEQRRMIHDLLPQRDRKDELMKIAEELLAVGVRADAVDRKQGTTLLMRAADVNAPVGFIDLMVRHGADVKARDGWGLTALHYAARNGRVDIVEFLVRAGANVNAQDDVGFTSLHEAAENDAVGVAHALLAAGADRTSGLSTDFGKYKAGCTPCGIARQKGHSKLADMLEPS